MNNLEKLLKEKCSNGVEFKRLEEIVNILDSQRKPITKSDRVSGVYRYYGANGIQDYVEDYIFDGTYILMGEDGSVVTEKGTPVLHWVTGKIWVNNHAHILEQKQNDALLKYIYYYLQTINIEHLVKGVPPKLNQQNMKNLKIAVPPVEVQEEIINILDKFNFLLEELKLEVSSRQQQYEFYRNKLLTFDESLESLDTLHTHTHTRILFRKCKIFIIRGNSYFFLWLYR